MVYLLVKQKQLKHHPILRYSRKSVCNKFWWHHSWNHKTMIKKNHKTMIALNYKLDHSHVTPRNEPHNISWMSCWASTYCSTTLAIIYLQVPVVDLKCQANIYVAPIVVRCLCEKLETQNKLSDVYQSSSCKSKLECKTLFGCLDHNVKQA